MKLKKVVCAEQVQLQEVAVCFGGQLMRGNRSQKVNASNYQAFDSPTYHKLALLGVEVDWQTPYLLQVRPQESASEGLRFIRVYGLGLTKSPPGVDCLCACLLSMLSFAVPMHPLQGSLLGSCCCSCCQLLPWRALSLNYEMHPAAGHY